jgi:hypothetical protein
LEVNEAISIAMTVAASKAKALADKNFTAEIPAEVPEADRECKT